MRRKRLNRDRCGVARALDAVGDWWTLLIVREAMLGATRFDEFQARLGASRNALSSRLERLTELGLMERFALTEGGLRQGYRLTEAGRDLSAVMVALRLWGDRWIKPEASEAELVDGEDGAPLAGLQAVTAEGRVVPRARIALRPRLKPP